MVSKLVRNSFSRNFMHLYLLFYLAFSGLRATIKYIGVKVPVCPPCAQPHPPCCNIVCTLVVPAGAKPIFSMAQIALRVMAMPAGLNWKRKLKGLLDGYKGKYHGSPPKRSSKAMSLASINYIEPLKEMNQNCQKHENRHANLCMYLKADVNQCVAHLFFRGHIRQAITFLNLLLDHAVSFVVLVI